MPLGFFCGGFSSTAGYVPGNEACVRRLKRRSTHLADHFQRALLVFIQATRASSFDASLASLSASAPSVPGSGFPLLLPSNDRVTASAPPLGAGQVTRKQSRL